MRFLPFLIGFLSVAIFNSENKALADGSVAPAKTNECSEAMQRVNQGFQKTQASANGQISNTCVSGLSSSGSGGASSDACSYDKNHIELKGSAINMTSLYSCNDTVAAGFDKAYALYSDGAGAQVAKIVAEIGATKSSPNGSGVTLDCVSPQVNSDINTALKAVIDSVAQMQVQASKFSEAEYAFNTTYLKVSGNGLTGYKATPKPTNNKNPACSGTAANIQGLSTLYSRVDTACSNVINSTAAAQNQLTDLHNRYVKCPTLPGDPN